MASCVFAKDVWSTGLARTELFGLEFLFTLASYPKHYNDPNVLLFFLLIHEVPGNSSAVAINRQENTLVPLHTRLVRHAHNDSFSHVLNRA